MTRPTIATFCTDRLAAERLRSEHSPEYVRLFSDPRVMATSPPDGDALSAEEATRWLGFSMEHWDRHGYGFWLLRTKSDGQFVGRAGFKNEGDVGATTADLGYALTPDAWGRGLATEIARAIVKLAFEQLGLADVTGCTLATNHASRRVMEKAGFRFVRDDLQEGVPHVFFRMTAADYAAIVARPDHP